jgi:hypothetical protein
MNKFLLCLAIIISSSAYALSPLEIVQSLSDQPNLAPSANEGSCNKCKESGLYTPQQALADINSGKLEFLGRDLFPGSDQNRTCVYKSETAYILYNNCLSSKKEGAVLDIEVISFNGGITRFYAEGDKVVSALKRSQYNDENWTLDYIPSAAPGSLNISELKNFKASANAQADRDSKRCFTTNGKARCFALPESDSWVSETEKFWKEPGEEWYKTQKLLRTAITNSRF